MYIDPSSSNQTTSLGTQYYVIGYKGTSPYDAGLFYCPYVPLQMVRAVGETPSAQKLAKTRYGIVANPFAEGTNTTNTGRITANSNRYYRRVTVKNLM